MQSVTTPDLVFGKPAGLAVGESGTRKTVTATTQKKAYENCDITPKRESERRIR